MQARLVTTQLREKYKREAMRVSSLSDSLSSLWTSRYTPFIAPFELQSRCCA